MGLRASAIPAVGMTMSVSVAVSRAMRMSVRVRMSNPHAFSIKRNPCIFSQKSGSQKVGKDSLSEFLN